MPSRDTLAVVSGIASAVRMLMVFWCVSPTLPPVHRRSDSRQAPLVGCRHLATNLEAHSAGGAAHASPMLAAAARRLAGQQALRVWSHGEVPGRMVISKSRHLGLRLLVRSRGATNEERARELAFSDPWASSPQDSLSHHTSGCDSDWRTAAAFIPIRHRSMLRLTAAALVPTLI